MKYLASLLFLTSAIMCKAQVFYRTVIMFLLFSPTPQTFATHLQALYATFAE